MKIKINFAQLHGPFFLAGKNFSDKLDPANLAGLSLEYDRTEKELLVTWTDRMGTHVGIIPYSNVVCMTEGEVKKKPVQITHPMVAGLQGAQVETPMSHVHAGYGHGKTGKGK